jgi:hypothetical protein
MKDSTRVRRAQRVVEAARTAQQRRATQTAAQSAKKPLPSVVANATDP